MSDKKCEVVRLRLTEADRAKLRSLVPAKQTMSEVIRQWIEREYESSSTMRVVEGDNESNQG